MSMLSDSESSEYILLLYIFESCLKSDNLKYSSYEKEVRVGIS